jgi:FkbM family methyltransferase
MPGMIGLFASSPYQSLPWEPMQEALLRRLVEPGDVVFDVGANIGLHSVLLAELVGGEGIVHAFEANPELYPMLRATFKQLPNARLHEFGLSDHDGSMQIFIPENREMASLASSSDAVGVQSCVLRSLDSCAIKDGLPSPDLIKADIEGAELFMLRGATRFFSADSPPIVLAEANRTASEALGYTSNAIPQFLVAQKHARYVIFVEETPDRWMRRSTFPGPLHQYVLAVPETRLTRWPELASATEIRITNGIPYCSA